MTMRVLVAVASKHGATQAIGERIGHRLGRCLAIVNTAVEVDIADPTEVPTVDRYDAVVIGSAVYAGHWLPSAQRLVARHRNALCERAVWCFSSGMSTQPASPSDEPSKPEQLANLIGACGYRVFGGKLDRTVLGFAERAIVNAVRAPDGDFRDWAQVDAWAAEIAAELADLVPRPQRMAMH